MQSRLFSDPIGAGNVWFYLLPFGHEMTFFETLVISCGQFFDIKLIALFDEVRKIPQVLDGIRCNCGCPNPPELRSLLSCYEGKGMARDCVICQGQARLAVRLHKEGKSLDEIRRAIDAKFA